MERGFPGWLNSLDNIKPMPGESFNAFKDRAFIAAMNDVFGQIFLENQTEEGVRKQIKRGDFKEAVKLMKAWFERKPEDVETLRMLKAELIARRTEVRAIKAGYARTLRRNRRAKRAAADVRACLACGAPMAGKRAGALTCSTKCRVKVFRAESRS